MSAPIILIVEDEYLIRLTLAEALTEDGFTVLEAATGAQALAAAGAQAGIALLLTDIQLPGGMDGVALARRLREAAPDLPVIFMTGRPDRGAAAAATARDVWITKPYPLSEVCAAARRLTRR